MEITLQILLGFVAAICFLGGLNLLVKGANSFLPSNTPTQLILDNLMRFLSGIYFGQGFLLSWAIFHLPQAGDLIYVLGLIVIFSGLGRLYSKLKVGSAGKYFDVIMIVEVLLGAAIMVAYHFK